METIPQRLKRMPAWAIALAWSLATAGTAAADAASLELQIHGGGSTGNGLSGDREEEAFHDGATGVTYGARVGIELLLVDLWLGHDQYVAEDGLAGTWTRLMLGFDVELPIGVVKGGTRTDLGEVKGGYASGYAELALAAGVAAGTGRQVDPPLDNTQVTDKGVVGQGAITIGYRLTPSWSAGFSVPVEVGYLVKSGDGADADDLDNHYTDIGVAALINLRFKVGLK